MAKIALKFYCRDVKITNRYLLDYDGPIMLAVNHPNSFLDAMILCTIFKCPVYSLARGDAFKRKRIADLLFSLKMLPVYRTSEGTENLSANYKTFDLCKKIFQQNGIVLIFSEGLCVNEWHLRPLKKGTARLAISCWEDKIPLKILPVGINYSSFTRFGKNIQIILGDLITHDQIDLNNGYGNAICQINLNLQNQLASSVFEIAATDKNKIKTTFYVEQSIIKKILLFIPSCIGWLFHAPLYYLVIYHFKKIKRHGALRFIDCIAAIFILSIIRWHDHFNNFISN